MSTKSIRSLIYTDFWSNEAEFKPSISTVPRLVFLNEIVEFSEQTGAL